MLGTCEIYHVYITMTKEKKNFMLQSYQDKKRLDQNYHNHVQ